MKDCQRQQGTSYPFHPPQTQRQGQSVARVGYYHLFLVVIANPSNVVEQKYQQGRAPCFLRQMILIRITMKIRIHFQCYHRLLLPRLPRRTETRGSISPFLRPSLPYSLGYSVADSHDGVNSLFQMYSTARNFGTLLWKKYWFIHYLLWLYYLYFLVGNHQCVGHQQ